MSRASYLTVLLIVLAFAAAGCGGGGGGGGAVPVGPSITNATVSPSNWSSGGGNVNIEANVFDAAGVASVTAAVTSSAGSKTVTLTQVSGDLFSGSIRIPANTLPGGPALVYSVTVSAKGSDGATSTAKAPSFSIPAPTAPPQPPISGS